MNEQKGSKRQSPQAAKKADGAKKKGAGKKPAATASQPAKRDSLLPPLPDGNRTGNLRALRDSGQTNLTLTIDLEKLTAEQLACLQNLVNEGKTTVVALLQAIGRP